MFATLAVVFVCGCVVSSDGPEEANDRSQLSFSKKKNHDFLFKIDKYELVELDFDSENEILSFYYSGELYNLYLSQNEDLILSNIKHTIDGKANDLAADGYVESCHYNIFESDNNDTSKIGNYKSAYGVVSKCSEYGIKGFISFTGTDEGDDKASETLIINPAINIYDELVKISDIADDDISNKYVIFKKSDFRDTEKAKATPKVKTKTNTKHTTQHRQQEPARPRDPQADDRNNKNTKKHNRNLLGQYNDGNNEVELIMYVDPYSYDYYLTSYGESEYYIELINDIGTIVLSMSNEYLSTNWGDNIGDISIHLVAIDVITSFNGIYASLYPDWYNDDSNSLDSNDYFNKFTNWLNNNNLGSVYDHSMLFTSVDMDDGNTKGMTYESGMCNDYFSSSIMELDEFEYFSSDVKYTAKHLLGHSFGTKHDSDTTCADNGGMLFLEIDYVSIWPVFPVCLACLFPVCGVRVSCLFSVLSLPMAIFSNRCTHKTQSGIMDFDGNDYFSSCTIESVEDFFNSYSDRISCMGDGVRSFTYDDDDTDQLVSRGACNSVFNCVTIDGTGWYGFDNDWHYRYCDDNYYAVYRIWSYYYVGRYYLYYNTKFNSWHINWDLGSDSAILYCGKNNLMDCGVGEWHEVIGDEWKATNGFTFECTNHREIMTNTNTIETSNSDHNITITINTSNHDAHNVSGIDQEYANDESQDSQLRGACSNVHNCVSIDGTGEYAFDNNWYYQYCDDNDNAVYRIYSWSKGNFYYLYYSTKQSAWHINYKISDSAMLYCSQSNLLDCDVGKWYTYNWDDEEWQVTNGFTYKCTQYRTDSNYVGYGLNFNITQNCSGSDNNIYGNNVCIYNNGILWKSGINTFVYEGFCKSNYPFYYSKAQLSDGSMITYYLHFDNNENEWIISSKGIYDNIGVAYCKVDSNLLSDCSYNKWYVKSIDIDSVSWSLSTSMGYDANCDQSVTTNDDNTQYCQSNFACAQWKLKFLIDNKNIRSSYCNNNDDDTSYGANLEECVTLRLSSDWTQIDGDDISLECDFDSISNSKMILNVNVSFTSTLGSNMYSELNQDYDLIFEYCDDYFNDNNETLKVNIIDSNLNVCDNCQSFLSNDNDNNSTGESGQTRNQVLNYEIFACVLIVMIVSLYQQGGIV